LKINILNPGLLSTVQDVGRPQSRDQGIPAGGAADLRSHRAANLLVGNTASAASVETAGGPFRARVERAGMLAVFGAGGDFCLNGKPLENGRAVLALAGSEIEIRPNAGGNFAYLATPGGWEVPEILGSRSTCLAAGFGGFEGRALRAGDLLSGRAVAPKSDFAQPKYWLGARAFQDLAAAEWTGATVIRSLAGPESDWWGEAARAAFFGGVFRVSRQRNRMGARLECPSGDVLHSPEGRNLLSTAVAAGTVQVPPDGQPIALLADAQTTGGYPRIAQVIAVDIPRLAQTPAGQSLVFQEVSLEEAEHLFFQEENLFRKIQLALRFQNG
jgi:antagonist of KipI